METATWPAHCPACARRYRVKSLGRALACKHCGAELVVDASAVANTTAASGAGETTPVDADPRSFVPLTTESDAESVAKKLHEFGRWIEPLRGLLILQATYCGVSTVLQVLEAAVSKPDPVFLAWDACFTTAFVVGAIMLRLQPFLVTAPLAFLEVANLGICALVGEPFGLADAIFAGCIVVGAVHMWRAQRFLREHPQAYGARAFTGVTSSRGRRASAGEMHVLRARAQRRALAWSAAAAVLILGSSWFGYSALRRDAPPLFSSEPAFAEVGSMFETAWNEADASGLVRFWPPDRKDVHIGFLSALELRGWTSTRPALRSSRFDSDSSTAHHVMDIPGGDVDSHWAYLSDEWRLQSIEMPLPLIRGFADEFTARWNAGEREAIQAMFVVDNGPDSASKRELRWESESRPPKIRDWGERQRNVHEVDVTFACEGGQIVSRCVLTKGGVWRIKALELPY
jgi:hypothetical protein